MRDFKEQTENIIERINKYKLHKRRQKKLLYYVTSFAAVVIIIGCIAIPQIRRPDTSFSGDQNGLVNSDTSVAYAEGYGLNDDDLNDGNSVSGFSYYTGGIDKIMGAAESATTVDNLILPNIDIKLNDGGLNSNVSGQDTLRITNKITDIVTKYNYEPYNNMLEVVKDFLDVFKIIPSNLNNLTIGAPFMIYDLDLNKQDGIFYYPVFDNDKVILNVSIMVLTSRLAISIDQQMVSQLNSINYVAGSCIFYGSNGSIVAESSTQKVYLTGSENVLCREFAALSVAQRVEKISTRIDSFALKDATQ